MTDQGDSPADTRDMYMVHTAFRREFGALPSLVRGAHPRDAERPHIIAAHIDVLSNFLDAHHRSEDIHLWPKLLKRGSQEVAPIVLLMEGQHEVIERLNAEVAKTASAWRANPTRKSRDVLADLLDQLFHELDDHMRLEERAILPLAEKYITAAEWHDMAGESGRGISRENIPLVFGMTLYEADPGVIQKILSELPQEVRSILQERGAREFSSHSERVHGTATPPRSGIVMRRLKGHKNPQR